MLSSSLGKLTIRSFASVFRLSIFKEYQILRNIHQVSALYIRTQLNIVLELLIFDDETRLIRAQTASLLKSVHLPVPRLRSYPISSLNRYAEYPARYSNDHYIHRLMQISPKNSKVEFVTYYTEPVKKYIGQGRLACISYIGDRGAYGRRRNVYVYEDPVKNDIQLLSFYINKFREEKQQKQAIEPAKVTLSPSRPSRRFNAGKHTSDETPQEIKELREARAARLAKINAEDKLSVEEDALKARKQREEAMLAEEKALAEEQAAQKAKESEEKKAKAAREAAERAAELERQAELLRLEEIAKLAEIERARKEEEERLKAEEERRLIEEAKAEEEKKQLRRLEEIARQAEEEREAELLRQAEELAELARQEAELAEQAKQEAEAAELARQQQELEELRRQEEELAELERQEKELEEAAQKAKLEAESAVHEDFPTDQENGATDIIAEINQDVEEKDDVEEHIESTEEGDLGAKYEVEFENEENEAPLEEADEDRNEIEPQEIEDEEPIAEAEDVPAAQGDTADEAEEEDE
ncbi:hypothetical protein WA026_011298 [Henosepilachna vigintioctopunctata]|uniref:Uncharacterized protein n=1 Tax=Henosepilachna vigintioctopunctata TaxID=420089 RepID=A0AAW1U5H1_9CUCU